MSSRKRKQKAEQSTKIKRKTQKNKKKKAKGSSDQEKETSDQEKETSDQKEKISEKKEVQIPQVKLQTTDMKQSLTALSTLSLNNGVKMPCFGLGTYKLKGKACYEAVLFALKLGYRHIDTAEVYGNEAEVGKAIKASGIPRKEIFVTTKLWRNIKGTIIGYEGTLKSFTKSLKKLSLTYVDLYLIHWPGPNKEDRKEIWRGMEKIYNDGQAKAIGVSNFTIKHLEHLLQDAKVVPAVNQVEFHPFLFQQDLLQFCKSKGIQLEPYSPLAKSKSKELLNHEIVVKIAETHKKTAPQILLRWALQHNLPCIPKSSRQAKIKENFQIFDFILSEHEMTEINKINRNWHCTWDPTNL